eukprot:6199847-Pleurochrysis_carterae.AAC.1
MAYVLQLQTLLHLKANEDADDLEDGGSGIDGRGVRRRATVRGRKRSRGLRSYMGYERTEEEEEAFEVEAVVGKVVADGRTAYANKGRVAAGVVLYRIVWQGYPPDLVWYEPGEKLGSELLRELEQSLAADAAANEASAKEDAEPVLTPQGVGAHACPVSK